MRIIDAHHHLWDLSVRDQDWTAHPDFGPIRRSFLIDEYERVARATGVTGSIVVQTICVPEETPELLALAAQRTLIEGVVGWLDLTAPDVPERITALRHLAGGNKLVGIRHQVQGEADGNWLMRDDVLRGLKALAVAGLVYDLVIRRDQLPAAALAAAAVPELRFVLDHLGKPDVASGQLEPWQQDLRKLAARGNTFVKLSGLVTEADWNRWKPADIRPYTEIALDAFGVERVMFGSDWPVCTLAAQYQGVLDLARECTGQLSDDEREAVFAGNAERVYRL